MLNITKQVEQVQGVVSDSITDALLYSPVPLVLKGFCQSWPIVKAGLASNEEAADYLRSVYSGDPVIASLGAPDIKGRVFYNEDFTGFNVANSRVDLNLVLDKILEQQSSASPATMYVGSTDAHRWFPKLVEDNDFNITNAIPIVSLWIGNQSRIAAHYDFPTNVACNVVGNRRFTLFPPDQISNLYPGPIEFAPGGQEISLVDFENPDFKKYPRFEQAIENALVAELAPGDALILPSMWWHHVEGLAPLNVLVTHWWRDTPSVYGRPNNALSMAIMAIRSLPKEQRMAWKHIFDHYIFAEELDQHNHIPEQVKGKLNLPLDTNMARQLRAELLNKLKR
ncbi:cupin-like domain-containing protein [Thalassotalea litorea]|uniref:Cupin-like domain-containing protein n=1 Tax=Thalassotalea litorea TaxID=2020715 RepID=A0A5R9INJ0_9GAMM|nr:cupin-like domain-containing protein [Thalassotalea litorea]TLU66842.1 cupin-like domain-containing protein [Thalassotalea litorea]